MIAPPASNVETPMIISYPAKPATELFIFNIQSPIFTLTTTGALLFGLEPWVTCWMARGASVHLTDT